MGLFALLGVGSIGGSANVFSECPCTKLDYGSLVLLGYGAKYYCISMPFQGIFCYLLAVTIFCSKGYSIC